MPCAQGNCHWANKNHFAEPCDQLEWQYHFYLKQHLGDNMTKAIRIHQTGGPEVLTWETVALGEPGPGQIVMTQTAVGINYIDIYVRTGLYPSELPVVAGMEAAGVVTQIGAGVSNLSVGDRVAYPMAMGAYAEARIIDAAKVVKIPDSISDQQAAAMMLKGLTAQYLLRRTYRVQPGDPILVYAAAGGVGLILTQWAKHLGAVVIGCVGSEDKAQLARDNGCDHTILYNTENVVERVKAITDGKGVAVVYDSIGQDTFMTSLDCLRPFGVMVTYGNATGKVAPFDLSLLAPKGSLSVTRPTLGTHIADRELFEAGAKELFDVVAAGHVTIAINQTFPLAEVGKAHQALESRQTTGSTVLIP
jgi:NADPH2:quinone reductase